MLSSHRESRQDFDHIDYLNLPQNSHELKQYRASRKANSITGLSAIGVWWCVLSFISLILSLISFYMPYWIQGSIESVDMTKGSGAVSSTVPQLRHTETAINTTDTYFGLWRRCNYHVLNGEGYLEIALRCGRYTTFYDIPTVWWKIAVVITALGCLLSMFVTFLGIVSCCINNVMSHSLARSVGVLQFIAG